jgi:hypothetical protein
LVAASCTAKPAQSLAQVYRIPAVLMDRLPDKGATLNERFHRLTLRDTAAEAVLDGGLAVEAATAVIDAVAEMDALSALEQYPGPVWLVNGARACRIQDGTPSRSEEEQSSGRAYGRVREQRQSGARISGQARNG